ncbi:hypothetical protein AUR64_00370 [Haloprofundus marisrubri]|uniref:Uncharacterized protein n=1 Tax=Haloprofundus marisrubri TaxID=1514971 RepID=A0A0W1RE21_9EURY|nr:hypothetical protein [Haloprofundus marisrubri]KTG11681.1 hypothetical protein AUR64_00370 [Haloprofundus marisrubri]
MSKPRDRTYPVEEYRENREHGESRRPQKQQEHQGRTSRPRRYDAKPNRLPHRTTESVDVVASRSPVDRRTASDDVVDSRTADESDGYERNRSPPVAVSSTSDSGTVPARRNSATSSPRVEPSETALDRLEAAETRIRQLESEVKELRRTQTVVDVKPRTKRRHSGSSKRTGRNSTRTSGGSPKPLRDRNDDRNLLPKQRSGLLPKKNDNLLRKLFWP